MCKRDQAPSLRLVFFTPTPSTNIFPPEGLKGLFEFSRRHPRYQPLVLCDRTQQATVARLGLEAMTWSKFLLSGPPGTVAAPAAGP